ncbi:hypothetical protein ACTM97_08260 [Oliverpabstia intestinalis]|uniref:hypothetical protein n=1 Tax=Oliverpabstia intestinalis TaxID=2606633 RepID=UPI003F8B54F4
MNVSDNRMTEEKRKSRFYPLNGIRVCIDREGETLAGRMYSKMTDDVMEFESTSKMLLEADMLFDEKGYPQRFMEARSFREKETTSVSYRLPEEIVPDHVIWEQQGKCCTIDIIVESRRKAGWQGTVCMPDRSHVREFKSELEMLKIMEVMIEMQQKSAS